MYIKYIYVNIIYIYVNIIYISLISSSRCIFLTYGTSDWIVKLEQLICPISCPTYPISFTGGFNGLTFHGKILTGNHRFSHEDHGIFL